MSNVGFEIGEVCTAFLLNNFAIWLLLPVDLYDNNLRI